jgi:hypothetical protein
MKNMKSRYIVGLLLIVLASCSSPITKEQKDADAVYLKQVKEYTLNADGSYSYHYYHKLLYNSYLSINRFYGETFVVYNPAYQSLKINKSETTMADGKKVDSPQNAFNEVLPSSAADAPYYNNLREMVITHVGLERGAVVELDYEVQTKAGFTPFLFDRVNLCESSPVKEVEVIVRVPKRVKLNYNLLNQPQGLTCKQSTQGEFEIYSWKTYNLSAISHEPLQIEGLTTYPTLMFSTVDLLVGFDYLKGNLTKNLAPHESATKLLKNEAKGWKRVDFISSYVVSNINTYGVSPVITGFRFRSPDDVWQSNGGTEGEKAILLASLLKLAGIKAEVVVAGYPSFFSSEVGAISLFDKFWVKVELDGETRIISAVEEHYKVPGQRICVAISDDIKKASFDKAPKPSLNFTLNAELNISSSGMISGKVDVLQKSFDDTKSILSGISTADYSPVKNSDAKESSYSISFKDSYHAEKVDGLYIFTLPNLTQGIESVGIGDMSLNRLTAIEIPGSINEEYSFTIKLPKGLTLISPINQSLVENGWGSCSITQTAKDDKVLITRKLAIKEAIISPENYNNFRQIVSLWNDKNLNKVVLKSE